MLVTAIVPTRNRRTLIEVALRSFLNQDWPEKELIVLDDGDDPVADIAAAYGARYAFYRERLPLGEKRNLACSMASGEIIVHFDDDDWSAPGRITDQVRRLESVAGAQVSGYNSIFFWSTTLRRSFWYDQGPPNYSCGTGLCYRRAWWKQNRFPAIAFAEDNAFVTAAQEAGVIVAGDGRQMLVARAHPASTSDPSRVGNNCWPEVPAASLPPQFFEAIGRL